VFTGYIELKNWKRLPVDSITDNEHATVDEVLGDIVAIATLFIHLNTRLVALSAVCMRV